MPRSTYDLPQDPTLIDHLFARYHALPTAVAGLVIGVLVAVAEFNSSPFSTVVLRLPAWQTYLIAALHMASSVLIIQSILSNKGELGWEWKTELTAQWLAAAAWGAWLIASVFTPGTGLLTTLTTALTVSSLLRIVAIRRKIKRARVLHMLRNIVEDG